MNWKKLTAAWSDLVRGKPADLMTQAPPAPPVQASAGPSPAQLATRVRPRPAPPPMTTADTGKPPEPDSMLWAVIHPTNMPHRRPAQEDTP